MAYMGRLRPKGVPFYAPGVGNLSFQMRFIAVKKSRKLSGFVIYSYFKDTAFTAVKKDENF